MECCPVGSLPYLTATATDRGTVVELKDGMHAASRTLNLHCPNPFTNPNSNPFVCRSSSAAYHLPLIKRNQHLRSRGRRRSRAVGRANGDNRLAIVIPCHRVVRSDGTLCGYGGGLWRKKWLLEHEERMAAKRRPGRAASTAA